MYKLVFKTSTHAVLYNLYISTLDDLPGALWRVDRDFCEVEIIQETSPDYFKLDNKPISTVRMLVGTGKRNPKPLMGTEPSDNAKWTVRFE